MPDKKEKHGADEVPVIGIGASAGGLDALQKFFDHLPVKSGAAYVVIVHLDPDHASLLPELLQRRTRVEVVSIISGMAIRADCVFVAPPNVDVSLSDNFLQLSPPGKTGGLRLPIDNFLISLAGNKMNLAACVILSGTGSDGTKGLKAIKEAGGLALIQDATSAKFSGMPHSAGATGLADFILPPEEMPEKLSKYFQAPVRGIDTDPESDDNDGTIRKIKALLQDRTGLDFTAYKNKTVLRRFERRMKLNDLQEPAQYIRLLKQSDLEADKLFHDILIGVTSFFRDPEAFDCLKQKLLAEVLPHLSADRLLRAWVPGCSGGEEVYSLAMIIQECLDERGNGQGFQVFGTDLDERAIVKARAGVYPLTIAADIEPERLSRFFVKEKNGYRVKRELRETIIFSTHNILKDPPFSNLDLLSCRNLLIYLTAETQKSLLPIFHFSLKPGRLMFLGTSEGIGRFSELFQPLSKKWKIYRRLEVTDNLQSIIGPLNKRVFANQADSQIIGDIDMEKQITLAELTSKFLVRNYAPACAVISRKGDIQYIHGHTGKYLEPAAGQPNMNIQAMARQGIQLELRAAISAAVASGTKVCKEGIRLRANGNIQLLNLTVQPLGSAGLAADFLVVVFEDLAVAETPKSTKKSGQKEREVIVKDLELELEKISKQHQSDIEEIEAYNEELKSYNEELQSANEELQSTNEELESSREEHQSMNEELMTVNAELQGKIDELSDVHNDMRNFLNSTEIATIFVDQKLNIKRFTPSAVKIANLIPTDVGRPLAHVVLNIDYPDLVEVTGQVIDTLKPREIEVSTRTGEWFQLRVLPYRTIDNLISGAVLTFSSIDTQKKTQNQLQELNLELEMARNYAENIIATVREALVVLDESLRVVSASRAFYEIFQVSPEETIARSIYELGNKQWSLPELRALFAKLLKESATFEDYQVELDFPRIGVRKMELNARRIKGGVGDQDLKILLAIEDVTEKGSLE